MTLPTANPFEIANFLPESFDVPKDPQQQILFFKDKVENIIRNLNRKDTGVYDLTEQVIGQRFPGANPQTKSNVHRKIFYFGAIAAGATLNIAHGIAGIVQFTRLYGTCITAVPDDRPIPFADITLITNQIAILRNGINIVIINGATAPNIASGICVAEVLKT